MSQVLHLEDTRVNSQENKLISIRDEKDYFFHFKRNNIYIFTMFQKE